MKRSGAQCYPADKLYPYRQTELFKRLKDRLGISVTGHDLQCVRRQFPIYDDPTFTHQAQFSPRNTVMAYVDWLVGQFTADSRFSRMRETRSVRGRPDLVLSRACFHIRSKSGKSRPSRKTGTNEHIVAERRLHVP